MYKMRVDSYFLFRNKPLAYETMISKLIKRGAERPSNRYFQIISNDECPCMSSPMRAYTSTCEGNCHYFLS